MVWTLYVFHHTAVRREVAEYRISLRPKAADLWERVYPAKSSGCGDSITALGTMRSRIGFRECSRVSQAKLEA
jgi:hypothetical protein